MGFFNKKKNSFVAIKLYCLGEPEDREALVTAILQVVQSAFGEPPADYDINGPYGVKKGSTIGLSAFKGLLSTKGHSKYFAVSGETTDRFGFHLLLGANGGNTSYSELIIWYASNLYSPNFIELVKPLLMPFNVACGFDIEIPEGHNISTETKIKRSLFGTVSVEVNNKHLAWLSSIHEGAVRGVYRNNIVNSQQHVKLASMGVGASQELGNGLYYINSGSN